MSFRYKMESNVLSCGKSLSLTGSYGETSKIQPLNMPLQLLKKKKLFSVSISDVSIDTQNIESNFRLCICRALYCIS